MISTDVLYSSENYNCDIGKFQFTKIKHQEYCTLEFIRYYSECKMVLFSGVKQDPYCRGP